MELLSKKQIQVISDFGCYRYRIHVGPYGCGKSYGLSAGFGLKLRATKPGKLGYLIVAKTASLAKSTIGDELSNLFGSDYQVTSSRKDDEKSKDAMLFGHRIYFGGMNDKEAIKRILGKSYKLKLTSSTAQWAYKYNVPISYTELSTADGFSFTSAALSNSS